MLLLSFQAPALLGFAYVLATETLSAKHEMLPLLSSDGEHDTY